MKIKSRNTLSCTCGSGKKFKKCCGAIQKNVTETGTDLEISEKFKNAIVYHQAGELDKAEAFYREILEADPRQPDVLFNLGGICEGKGELGKAKSFYEKVLENRPDYYTVYNNLGAVYYKEESYLEARSYYEKALSFKPDFAEAWNNLGMVFKSEGKFKEAEEFIKKAIFLKPDYADAYNNLGATYLGHGDRSKKETAIACLEKAIKINPRHAGAYNNIGNILRFDERLEEAESYYLKAITIDPKFPDAYSNLGNIYELQGRAEEAVEKYRKTLELAPKHVIAQSNLLLALNYSETSVPSAVYSEHLLFEKNFGEQFKSETKPYLNDLSPDRKLKIGYISPDFRTHSVAYFIEPVLANHDSQKFEIIGYSNSQAWDQMTRQLHSYVDKWRNISGIPVHIVDEMIRMDQIDILIDLSGHTAGNRLLVFARKPAPVQVTWLGYPNTTGLRTMDYRITDRFADPVGVAEQFHTEQLIRLPKSFSCYRPPDEGLEVEDTPAIENGFITFGSFNNFSKVTLRVIQLWAKVLRSVPDSRLILKTGGLNEKSLRDRVYDQFASMGVSANRLELLGRDASREEHFRQYRRLDIGLDPFPYNGTTTICESLWMGVPVVTLEGQTHAGRVGVSLMNTLELTELIARSENEYVDICVRLANDLVQLSQLRAGMRSRMKASPLMNEKEFTQYLEDAYRNIWKDYVRRQGLMSERSEMKNVADPEVNVRIDEAQNLLKEGRLDQAEILYREILTNHSKNPTVLHDLGIVAFHKGQLARAADFFIKALAFKPDYATAYNNLGAVCDEMGRQEDAKACYEMSLVLVPNYAEAHHNLGVLYKKQGIINMAMDFFQKALDLNPEYLEARKNIEELKRMTSEPSSV
ncbi:MAG: tetratricopeptide repeat protein [Nitrospirae bacterium]|nr:tetratricopeptide repeat protein [Nitrospirota bacterium]